MDLLHSLILKSSPLRLLLVFVKKLQHGVVYIGFSTTFTPEGPRQVKRLAEWRGKQCLLDQSGVLPQPMGGARLHGPSPQIPSMP